MITTPLQIQAIAEFSDQGTRSIQEDCSLGIKDKGIFVMVDGFGGPVAGVSAARESCEAVRQFLVKEAGDRDATLPFVLRSYFSLAGNVLFNALIYANMKLGFLNADKGVHEKGGASVIAGYLDGDLLALANAGVCTAWLFRDGKASELVIPRTYARMLDPFSQQAPDTFQIPLMALGMAEDLEPEIVELRLRTGDWLLLQTDGLRREVVYFIQELQARGTDPVAAVREVGDLFSSAEHTDNATAQLVFFK